MRVAEKRRQSEASRRRRAAAAAASGAAGGGQGASSTGSPLDRSLLQKSARKRYLSAQGWQNQRVVIAASILFAWSDAEQVLSWTGAGAEEAEQTRSLFVDLCALHRIYLIADLSKWLKLTGEEMEQSEQLEKDERVKKCQQELCALVEKCVGRRALPVHRILWCVQSKANAAMVRQLSPTLYVGDCPTVLASIAPHITETVGIASSALGINGVHSSDTVSNYFA